MMVVVKLRHGIGFDIEFNEDICHLADTHEGKQVVLAYIGVIVMLPFVKIYVGDFEEIIEVEEQ